VDEKIDLSTLAKVLDKQKEETLRSKDFYKFVIGLSTGALLISLTFIDKFRLLPAYKPFIVIGWICLIVSIITGVWLLQKRDSLESQWNSIIYLLSQSENILYGIEPDISKVITRSLISGFLKEEMSKDTKDEEKIKKLKKEWFLPNGSKGKVYLKKLISVLAEVYPPLAKAMPDITEELENWEKLINKYIKSLYLPSMSKKPRETIIWVECIQKAMTISFHAGIILITVSSAFSFMQIDLIGMIQKEISFSSS
jgi:hypothetical protein